MGPVERAVRTAIAPGSRLPTTTGRGTFVVEALRADALVLLLGEQRAWTSLAWDGLEGLAPILRSRDWVKIGGRYEVDGDPGTLDGYLKTVVKRATAGWVAVVLERAGVVELDRSRPAKVRLRSGF